MSAPVGSLAAEAVLLLDAIAGRLEALRPSGAEAGAAAQDGEPAATGGSVACPQCGHDPAASAACTACPLCRLVAAIRGERPETTSRLVEGALVVVQSLRALLPDPGAADAGPMTAHASPPDSPRMPPNASEPRTPPPPVSAPVAVPPLGGLERIIVR